MVDELTRLVVKIICGSGGDLHILDVLRRYNELVFAGRALCTNWSTAVLSIPGAGRFEVLICESVVYVLNYLDRAGAIRIKRGGEIELLDKGMCRGG